MCKMVRKIIPQNLKPQARLKYIKKGERNNIKKTKSTICVNSFQKNSMLSIRLTNRRRAGARILMETTLAKSEIKQKYGEE